ncbi:MAG: HAMP domain-containing protein [Ruminococcaceae bacterium]|nr:HAMP domain-containing protein [Oscillospiraceae bacterium]
MKMMPAKKSCKGSKGFRQLIANMKFRNKLLVAFVPFTILPFLIFLLINGLIVSPLLVRDTMELEKNTVAQYCNHVNSRWDLYESVAERLLTDHLLFEALTKEYRDPVEVVDAYQTVFDLSAYRYSGSIQDVTGIAFFTDNPTLLYDQFYVFEYSPETMGEAAFDYFSEKKASNRVFISEKGEISFFQRLNFYQAKKYPVARMTISRTGFLGVLPEDSTGDWYLLDNQGGYLIIRGEESAAASVLAMGEGISGKDPVICQNPETNENIIYQKTDFGWTIAKVVQPTGFFTSAQNVSHTVSFLIVVCMFVFLGMILVISRHLTTRIETLSGKIDRIKAGEYDALPPVTGTDEIGQTGLALDELAAELKQTLDTVYNLQLRNSKLQLDVMQAKINPHFLYNTLSAIDWSLENREIEKTRELLQWLVQFYRRALNPDGDIVRLSKEIELAQMYLNIESHLREDVSYEVEIPPYLEDAYLPHMTLQPIVENAIKHAFQKGKHLHIRIRGWLEKNTAVISVQDDGVGFSPQVAARFNQGESFSSNGKSSGIGLTNAKLRLKLTFGEQSGLTIREEPGIGGEIQIRVPMDGIPERFI